MKMGRVFIIHGSFSKLEDTWIPWLRRKLQAEKIKVAVPNFPLAEGLSLYAWLEAFREYREMVDRDAVMVGHGLGSTFILRYLEHSDDQLSAAFLTAPFFGELGDNQVDKANKTFVEKEFDWKKIKRRCTKFYVYGSDDDPYVPLEQEEQISDCLDATLRILPGAGHMNKASGYTKFDDLFKDIKNFHK
ncbi:MAG: serine hydrolase family protein [Candidatus Micrarchaeota archaeon]|nr:serine hydrolase family protein [Candidatus Micrarchaeota archaeon]MDE1847905.1 serine hydrolase family protein [Candidatus Micrarchaeota archaeon]MDE1864531.1 serine hydrolase family protein [Candidatus Micrarchaeota archaeon]